MKRWHDEVPLMQKRQRSFLLEHDVRPAPLGSQRKRHPGDCGRARCGVCHPSKRFGISRRGVERRRAIAGELSEA